LLFVDYINAQADVLPVRGCQDLSAFAPSNYRPNNNRAHGDDARRLNEEKREGLFRHEIARMSTL
jgi:hypothetical protein